jgi:hypothetical protein
LSEVLDSAASAQEAAMLMRVREKGDEIHIELSGVAGRQQSVLRALTECRHAAGAPLSGRGPVSEVSVRAGANDMRIRLKGNAGLHFEARAIYHALRRALFDRPRVGEQTAVAG